MASEPGVSVPERLGSLREDFAFLHGLLDKLSAQDEDRARLSKAASARAGRIEQELAEVLVRLPGKLGRPLDEIPPIFVQEILRLHEELGWGRPRILKHMRDRGVTERQVRRVLAERAGRNPGPVRRPS